MMSSSPDWSSRPLAGWVVGVSVANSEDLASHGYSPDDVNRATVRLAEALLSSGARLIFGHDWRPDGVMEAICRIAVTFQPPVRSMSLPLIQNLLPWPAQPTLEPNLRADLEKRGLLLVQPLELPNCDWNSPDDPLARAIALTSLRRELAKRSHARVCLGGKSQSSEGFFAGIAEEAYYAAVAGQPVYLGGFLGGAAAQLISTLEHPQTSSPILKLLEAKKPGYRTVRDKFPALAPSENLTPGFRPEILQKQSGLSLQDWHSLIHAPEVEHFSALVIRGLSRLPNPQGKEGSHAHHSPSPAPGPTPERPSARSKRRKK